MLLSAPPLLQHVVREAAVHDIDGKAVVLRQRADRPAADVRSVGLAAVARERGVDDPQPAAAVEDGASAAAVEALAVRVAVGERQVLDDQLGGRLILAVRRRPHLCRIAGVHVEDAVPALAAERHQPTAVEDDPRARVRDLGGRVHPDRDGLAVRTRSG